MKYAIAGGLLCAASSLCSVAQADTLLGGYVGAQVWNMGVDGGFANQQALTSFSYGDNKNMSYYAALEHPIPLIPNIKIAHTAMDTSGATNLSAAFSFADQLYLTDTVVVNDIEMTATDIILYYELLDNDLVSFDVGISAKQVDGTIMVRENAGQLSSMQDFKGLIPMVYSKLAVGLPLTGLGVYVEGSYLGLGDSKLSDIQAAITYSFVETLALDLSLQAGYRTTTLELDDFDNTYTDLDFSGVFVGLEFDF